MALSSHYWNINSIRRTKKMILRPAAVVCCCQNASCRKELQPEYKYWLVVQWAEQVWQNITDARLMLHCLGAQQVKTPPHHSFRQFSCYICTRQPTASRAVCAVNAYISHRVRAEESCAGNWPDWMVCPGAMRDRHFLYPVVDVDGPHLGCNLEGLITRKQREANSACPTSNTVGQ